MTNTSILRITCKSCGEIFKPYGETLTVVPTTATIACPHCSDSKEYTWYDDDTNVKLIQKQLGLEDSSKIQEFETRLDLLTKELELEKGKRELLQSKMEHLENWKKEREQMFKEIESFYAEEKQFREDNK